MENQLIRLPLRSTEEHITSSTVKIQYSKCATFRLLKKRNANVLSVSVFFLAIPLASEAAVASRHTIADSGITQGDSSASRGIGELSASRGIGELSAIHRVSCYTWCTAATLKKICNPFYHVGFCTELISTGAICLPFSWKYGQ
jgi:hypothetical protein